MTITNIKTGKKGNILIYADGEYVLSVPREVFLKAFLKKGDTISKKDILSLSEQTNAYKANFKALNLLSYRAHSKKELEEKLKHRIDEKSAKIATEKMENIGLINDEAYAKEYAMHLSKNKMYSLKRISFELSKKGIEHDIISKVFEEIEINEEENIQKILSKKTFSNEKEKKRVIAYLIRLGYSWEKIIKFLE